MQVRVYRNLNRRGRDGHYCWSVQARLSGVWRVIAYADDVAMTGAVFFASETQRLRCLAAGKREVHAWATGELDAIVGCILAQRWATPELTAALAAAGTDDLADLAQGVTYRPKERSDFRLRSTGAVIRAAGRVHFRIGTGCTVSEE